MQPSSTSLKAPDTPPPPVLGNNSPASALSSAELRNRLRESKNDFQSRINAVKLSSALASAASVTGTFSNSTAAPSVSMENDTVTMNDIHTANLVNAKVLADFYSHSKELSKDEEEASIAQLEKEILDLESKLEEKVAELLFCFC